MRRQREIRWPLCLHADLGEKRDSVLTIKEWCNGILRCPSSTLSFFFLFMLHCRPFYYHPGTRHWELCTVSPQTGDTQIVWLLLLIKKKKKNSHKKNTGKYMISTKRASPNEACYVLPFPDAFSFLLRIWDSDFFFHLFWLINPLYLTVT